MNEKYYLIAKVLHLQETNVSLAEKNVPNWEIMFFLSLIGLSVVPSSSSYI